MNPSHFAARYTGTRAVPFAPPGQPGMWVHGGAETCHQCGHPRSCCQCGCRECRKESKELVAGMPTTKREAISTPTTAMEAIGRLPGEAAAKPPEVVVRPQEATAFIGGGCCVHLSLEYAPNTPTAASRVAVIVEDADGTNMTWERAEKPGTGYQVKEGVISTRPGAKVALVVVNMTARLRWCEIFSC